MMHFKSICSPTLFLWYLLGGPKMCQAQLPEPGWFPLIEVIHEGPRLDRCNKRNGIRKPLGPPPNGQKCARRPKTCYFEDQFCGDTLYPAIRCDCTGRTWQCNPVSCLVSPSNPISLYPTAGHPLPTNFPTHSAAPSVSPSTGGPKGSIAGHVKAGFGLSGVSIRLLDDSGTSIAATVTDFLGEYVFYDLPFGAYHVVETNVAAYLDVSDVDGGDPNRISVTIGFGNVLNSTANDFVDAPSKYLSPSDPLGSISGTVAADEDNDGSSDLLLGAVTIRLLDHRSAIIATTVTGASGVYVFYDVPVGVYEVVETNIASYPLDVSDTDGGDPNRISVTIDAGSGLHSKVNDFLDASSSMGSPLGTISGGVLGALSDRGADVLLGGVPIQLLDDSGVSVAETVTDVNGYYVFYDLPVGSYVVVETNIPSYPLDVSDFDEGDPNRIALTIDQDNGLHSTHNYFKDQPLRFISGQVLEDTDQDGDGDCPIPLVTITVFDSNDDVVGTTLTDSNGSFRVLVPPGFYTLVETNLEFYSDVSDSDGSNDNLIVVDVTSANHRGDIFVDEISSSPHNCAHNSAPSGSPAQTMGPLGTISGVAIADEDNDLEGETLLEGVHIRLLDDSGATVATTVTDASGYFIFYDLPLGSYEVVETNNASYPVDFGDVDGGDPNRISVVLDPSHELHSTDNVFIDAPALNEISSSAPSEPPLPTISPSPSLSPAPTSSFLGSIQGKVRADTNNDNAGDFDLQGVPITLLDDGGVTVGTTVTDDEGNYFFSDLPMLQYEVVEVNLDSYRLDVSDSDGGDPNRIFVTIDLIRGLNSTANDFVDAAAAGSLSPSDPLGSITGTVAADEDNDGRSDLLLGAVTIRLLDHRSAIIATTVTGASGVYVFYDVPVGVYEVVETNIASYPLDVSDTDGGDPNRISVTIDAGSGLHSKVNDFLDASSSMGSPLGTISGGVNGVFSDRGADVLLGGVPIQLLDDSGVSVAETVTDVNGYYVFYDLPVGSYVVVETNIPSYPLDVSDFDEGDPNRIALTIDQDNGLHSTHNYFKDQPLRFISGLVLEDTDQDGDGDRPIPLVTITVFDSNDDVVGTTLTDSNGSFRVLVPPGFYTLVETNLGFYSDVSDSDGSNDNLIVVDMTSANSTSNIFVDEISSSAHNSVPSGSPAQTMGPAGSPSTEDPLSSIQGNVKLDTDGDGVGDVGRPRVFIRLVDDRGVTVGTTLTDKDGNYAFSNLALAGSYEVVKANLVGDSSRISVTIDPGVSSFDNNFVDKNLERIDAIVLEDTNGDGRGDSPIPGVTVTVVDSSTGNVVVTTLTDDSGRILVVVPPGVYTLIETNLPTYSDVSDSDGGDPNVVIVDVTTSSSSDPRFVDEIAS